MIATETIVTLIDSIERLQAQATVEGNDKAAYGLHRAAQELMWVYHELTALSGG